MLRVVLPLAVLTIAHAADVPLTSLKPNKVKSEPATYKGKSGVRVTDAVADQNAPNEDRVVVLTGTKFTNGVIEAELSGEPAPGAGPGARGFVGIAFRISPDVSKFECFYLRPTNGRADDQVRRNHSLQYISFPEFPWQRLRKEFPEMYESYADLVPGEWTKVRIGVDGNKGRLFVNGAPQPGLIVNDLKLGASASGPIGLWIGPGTVAHFANIRITEK